MENTINVIKLAVVKRGVKSQYILRTDKPFIVAYNKIVSGASSVVQREEQMLESDYLKIAKA